MFQRTPSSISVRNNRATDSGWMETQTQGWQNKRRTNFESFLTGAPVAEDLVSDGWTEAFRLLIGQLREQAPSKWRLTLWALSGMFSRDMYREGVKKYLTDKAMKHMDVERKVELADFANMEKIRARDAAVVEDPETAESLKPYYRQCCKRQCFHDEYLLTYNRPNVMLVDTDGNQLPYLDELRRRFIPDSELMNTDIIAGKVDVQGQFIKFEDMPLYKENEEKGNY